MKKSPLIRILISLILWMLIPGMRTPVEAQVTGGRHVFSFLNLSPSPHITALGGLAIAAPQEDVSFGLQNPSLLRPALHNRLGLTYDRFYASISHAQLQYAYHLPSIETSFGLGVQYLNYGDFVQTDFIGQQLGLFQGRDYAFTLGAARAYGPRWRYGMNLKMAGSMLGSFRASALMADLGLSYYDSSQLLMIGLVARHMGFMTRVYQPGAPDEPLPFDLQLGISKRFLHLPLRLMTTVHHLYEWDIRYDNPLDQDRTQLFAPADSNTREKSYFADKLFRHFIFGAEIELGKRVQVSVGYNHLRRAEMAMKERPGLAGFSFGLGVDLQAFHIRYGQHHYHIAGAHHEWGIELLLHRLTGLGKLGQRIGWDQRPSSPSATDPSSLGL